MLGKDQFSGISQSLNPYDGSYLRITGDRRAAIGISLAALVILALEGISP